MLATLGLHRWSLFLFLFGTMGTHANTAVAQDGAWALHWDRLPELQASTEVAPIRESALSPAGLGRRSATRGDEHLELALKHYPQPGAVPVILIHGMAQNDRMWDSRVPAYNFARFLHSQGFDVWIANLRGAGTEGFRSEQPAGAHHWTVDDYAAFDIPAIITRVTELAGQKPFIITHSMAAWALEGYFAGLAVDAQGRLKANPARGRQNQAKLRGAVTIAGVYNVWWRKPVADFFKNPIRNEADYYGSNYELELLAKVKPLYDLIPKMDKLPLNWIDDVLSLPLEKVPFIGMLLNGLYIRVQHHVVQTPFFNMFYYAKNADPEMVRMHVQDGMEDLGPRLVEQLGNAVKEKRTMTYYHGEPDPETYSYASVRRWGLQIPILFVGAGRDRLASVDQIYKDGFQATKASDKQFLGVEEFGHLDVVSGKKSASEVMVPIVEWLRKR